MEGKQSALRYFRRLKGTKKKGRSYVEFDAAINILKVEAENGFNEEELEVLIDALVLTEELGSKRFQDLLRCIVPEQRVPPELALKVMEWVFSYHRTAPVTSMSFALEWIIGLIEFGLTEEETLHAFYNHLFLLIERRTVGKLACKLIHLLTKPSDIYRWRVKRILDIEFKYKKQKHTNAILSLFKSYKPECVPEKVPAMSIKFAFRNIGKMNQLFQKAQERLGTGTRDTRRIEWEAGQAKKKAKTEISTIPPVEYVHFESAQYRDQPQLRSILEFKTLTSLGTCLPSLDIPCNSMSLLQNSAGIHILAFGDKTLHNRFSYNLYYILHRAFIEQEKGFKYKEKVRLLKQVYELEEYMQQGVPVVSRILAEYLLVWDGEDFRKYIFRLLEWVTFSSYQELYTLILDPIRILFITSQVVVKCSILSMLSRFVQNLIAVVWFRMKKEKSCLFLGAESEWCGFDVFQSIVKFVSDLCNLGLLLENGSYLILNEALNFFELINFLEERHNLPIWTIMPPSVVYNGLITRNALMLDRVCGILVKYESVDPRLKALNLRMEFDEHFTKHRMYLSDFINCLWRGKGIELREEGYIFSDMKKRHIRSLNRYMEPNGALVLEYNIALMPYVYSICKDSDCNEEDLIDIIRTHLKGIHNLVELGKKQIQYNIDSPDQITD